MMKNILKDTKKLIDAEKEVANYISILDTSIHNGRIRRKECAD
jgi:hypothetical protein